MKLIVEIDLPNGATPLDTAAIQEEYMSLVRERLVVGTHKQSLDMIRYMSKLGKTDEEIKRLTDIYEYQADLFDAMRMRIE